MDTKKINQLFKEDLTVLNIGLDLFYESLKDSGAKVINTDWQPPAGGDEKMLDILSRLKGS